MAVEVTSLGKQSPRKHLHKHAVPVIMVALALLALPATVLTMSHNADVHSEMVLGRGLITRVVHVQPTSNGLAKVTLSTAPNTAIFNSDTQLPSGLGQSGRSAQLSFSLQ